MPAHSRCCTCNPFHTLNQGFVSLFALMLVGFSLRCVLPCFRPFYDCGQGDAADPAAVQCADGHQGRP